MIKLPENCYRIHIENREYIDACLPSIFFKIKIIKNSCDQYAFFL